MAIPGTIDVDSLPGDFGDQFVSLANEAYARVDHINNAIGKGAEQYLNAMKSRVKRVNNEIFSLQNSSDTTTVGDTTIGPPTEPHPQPLPSPTPIPPPGIPPPGTPIPTLPQPSAQPPITQSSGQVTQSSGAITGSCEPTGPPPGWLLCPPGSNPVWNATICDWECQPSVPPPQQCQPRGTKPFCPDGFHAVWNNDTCKWDCVCDNPSDPSSCEPPCVARCCPDAPPESTECGTVSVELKPFIWVKWCCIGVGEARYCCYSGFNPPQANFGEQVAGPVGSCEQGKTLVEDWLRACLGGGTVPRPPKPPCVKGNPPVCPDRYNAEWDEENCTWKCVPVICGWDEEIYQDCLDGRWKCRKMQCTGGSVLLRDETRCKAVCSVPPVFTGELENGEDLSAALVGQACNIDLKGRQCQVTA